MEQDKTVVQSANKATNLAVIILSIVVLALIAIIGMLVYKQTDVTKNNTVNTAVDKNQNNDKSNEKDSKADTKKNDSIEKTPSNQDLNDNNPSENNSNTSVPHNWRAIENSNYRYTAYIPPTYYYRFFNSAQILGIDPNELPEASEYMGI